MLFGCGLVWERYGIGVWQLLFLGLKNKIADAATFAPPNWE